MSLYRVVQVPSSGVACATGGDDGTRTHDPLLAGQVLYQLSYTPMPGLSRKEAALLA